MILTNEQIDEHRRKSNVWTLATSHREANNRHDADQKRIDELEIAEIDTTKTLDEARDEIDRQRKLVNDLRRQRERDYHDIIRLRGELEQKTAMLEGEGWDRVKERERELADALEDAKADQGRFNQIHTAAERVVRAWQYEELEEVNAPMAHLAAMLQLKTELVDPDPVATKLIAKLRRQLKEARELAETADETVAVILAETKADQERFNEIRTAAEPFIKPEIVKALNEIGYRNPHRQTVSADVTVTQYFALADALQLERSDALSADTNSPEIPDSSLTETVELSLPDVDIMSRTLAIRQLVFDLAEHWQGEGFEECCMKAGRWLTFSDKDDDGTYGQPMPDEEPPADTSQPETGDVERDDQGFPISELEKLAKHPGTGECVWTKDGRRYWTTCPVPKLWGPVNDMPDKCPMCERPIRVETGEPDETLPPGHAEVIAQAGLTTGDSPSDAGEPVVIKGPLPGQAVDEYLKVHGHLPNEDPGDCVTCKDLNAHIDGLLQSAEENPMTLQAAIERVIEQVEYENGDLGSSENGDLGCPSPINGSACGQCITCCVRSLSEAWAEDKGVVSVFDHLLQEQSGRLKKLKAGLRVEINEIRNAPTDPETIADNIEALLPETIGRMPRLHESKGCCCASGPHHDCPGNARHHRKAAVADERRRVRTILANDGYAISCQSLGQYRSLLVKEIIGTPNISAPMWYGNWPTETPDAGEPQSATEITMLERMEEVRKQKLEAHNQRIRQEARQEMIEEVKAVIGTAGEFYSAELDALATDKGEEGSQEPEGLGEAHEGKHRNPSASSPDTTAADSEESSKEADDE